MSNIIMGIDQSLTNTGIAILKEGNPIHFDLIKTVKTKDSKAPTIDATTRLISIRETIFKLALQYDVSYYALEGMAFGMRNKSNTIMDIGGLSHVIRESFLDSNQPFIIVPPTVLKKFFTGNGKADKVMMCKACAELGIDIPFTKKVKGEKLFNDNVVDAYALALYLHKYLDNSLGSYYDPVKKKEKQFKDLIEKSWDLNK